MVISATILSYQSTDGQNIGESSLHSKTYGAIAIQTDILEICSQCMQGREIPMYASTLALVGLCY